MIHLERVFYPWLKMDYKLLCLVLALATSISASQIMTIEPTCFTAGDQLKLKCETLNFASSVFFYLQGVSKGGCSSSGVCLTGITGYQVPSQSGTITEMIISNYDNSRDGGDWTCEYGGASSIVKTVALGNCDSTCDGTWKAGLLLFLLCYLPPLVKILIILFLWYTCLHNKRTQEVTYITIIVTAQKIIRGASTKINNASRKVISLCENCHEVTIRVRGGDEITCAFTIDNYVLTFTFKIEEDMLYVRFGQKFKIPRLLRVHPRYSTITLGLNGHNFINGDSTFENYKTEVTEATYGKYDIKMTFREPVEICIRDIDVKHPKDRPPPRGRYWKLMGFFFVVIDIVLAVIGGSVTGYNRSTDGFCVEISVIIVVLVVPLVIFNAVEVVLIYFMLINGTENEESSGSAVSSSVKTTTSTTGQNSREWQPPN